MDNSDTGSIREVLRILVLVQGAIAFTTALQVLAAGTLLGAPVGLLIPLGFFAAGLTMFLAARIVRRSGRARKALVVIEVLWLIGAGVDLALRYFWRSAASGSFHSSRALFFRIRSSDSFVAPMSGRTSDSGPPAGGHEGSRRGRTRRMPCAPRLPASWSPYEHRPRPSG